MKEPHCFPSANVKHGCHCALLFRLPTVLTWDGCRMPGSGHTRQNCGSLVQTCTLLTSIYPYCSDPILLSGFGMSDHA
ncbi:hypothetical protein M1D30_03935 [Prevotella sp. E15-22]|uniref:hypothetical protein n=1 Tax=Prevotella sp. E15-22 TaxID=2937774 RepID=UPI002055541B|nr:hypothetical protein [Prevotella sp. E15-22]UPS45333.1 hypothetical protein M1D30_03935 [Prevotella sp. E15-22]